MRLVPGAMVTHGVRLVRPLAEGAMGSVWVAENVAIEAPVAVKFLSTKHTPDAEAVRRFEREAKAAARINSAHVVRPLDYGVLDDGVPYIVLELLDGESLRRLLDRLGAMTLPETQTVMVDVCRALGAAHALGIVHRDVKPENVFLSRCGEDAIYKLLDFGVAKRTRRRRPRLDARVVPGITPAEQSALTWVGTLVGTPAYMSPEQIASDEEVTRHADLWATSVLAYECLTGRLPFDDSNLEALTLALIRGVYIRPSTVVPELGNDVDAWFAKAFAKERADRFDTSEELARTFGGLAVVPADEPDGTTTRVRTIPGLPAVPASMSITTRSRRRLDPAPPPRRTARWFAAAFTAMVAIIGFAWVSLRGDATGGQELGRDAVHADVADRGSAAGVRVPSPPPMPSAAAASVASTEPTPPEPSASATDGAASPAPSPAPRARTPRPSSSSSSSLPPRNLGF